MAAPPAPGSNATGLERNTHPSPRITAIRAQNDSRGPLLRNTIYGLAVRHESATRLTASTARPPLNQDCHCLRTEVTPILFSSNTFHFTNWYLSTGWHSPSLLRNTRFRVFADCSSGRCAGGSPTASSRSTRAKDCAWTGRADKVGVMISLFESRPSVMCAEQRVQEACAEDVTRKNMAGGSGCGVNEIFQEPRISRWTDAV